MSDTVNIALVPVEGDLDVTSVPGAQAARVDRLVARGCRRVIMNMADVSYVDSAGLGLILTEARRLRGVGGLLSLVNVSPQAYHALRRMRVLDHMPVLRAGAEARLFRPARPVRAPCLAHDVSRGGDGPSPRRADASVSCSRALPSRRTRISST